MISNWSILGVPEITTKPRPKRPNADKAARAGRDGGNPQKSAILRIELSQPVAGLWHAFWNPSLTGGTTDATGAAWDGFFDLYPRDSLHPMLELPACKFFIRQIPFVVRDVRVAQVVHGRYVPKKGSSVGETKAFSHRVEHTVQ